MNQFGKFIQERKYLQKVSPRTLTWYAESFKWFGTENPTDDELKNLVIQDVRKGSEGDNLQQQNQGGQCVSQMVRLTAGPWLHVAKLKEPSDMLPTFKPGDITAIAGFKPRSFRERRTVVLLLTLVSLHDTSTGRIAPFNFTRKPRCQSKF